MILHPPFMIGLRLLPALRVGNAVISIEYASHPGREGRTRWRYFIDAPQLTHEDDDLQSGCQGGSLQEGMESLLTFLSAAGEAMAFELRTGRVSENLNLFPPKVVEWAYQNQDEISAALSELQDENGNPLKTLLIEE